MAATRQQGVSLMTLLTGFTLFFAGLASKASYPALGIIVAIIGAVLLIASALSFHRAKNVA